MFPIHNSDWICTSVWLVYTVSVSSIMLAKLLVYNHLTHSLLASFTSPPHIQSFTLTHSHTPFHSLSHSHTQSFSSYTIYADSRQCVQESWIVQQFWYWTIQNGGYIHNNQWLKQILCCPARVCVEGKTIHCVH